MDNCSTESKPIPKCFHKYIGQYTDSEDFSQAKKVIRSLSSDLNSIEEQDKAYKLEFLEQLLLAIQRAYSSHCDYNASEDAFNQAFVRPLIEVIGRNLNDNKFNADFVEGQPFLESMTKQLKSCGLYIDDKSQYKSDGLIKLFGLKEMELLLVETSGCFGNQDKTKLNFDHHKGTFGTLAMIKTIADEFEYASIKTFRKVKVFFLNAGGARELHFWSVSYNEEDISYLLREAALFIHPDFDSKQDSVPDLVKFCWEVKICLDTSIKRIASLKDEHSNTLKSDITIKALPEASQLPNEPKVNSL